MKKWILVGLSVAGLGVWFILHLIPSHQSRAPAQRMVAAVASARSAQAVVATADRVSLQVAALNGEVSALRAELAQVSQPPAKPTSDTEPQPETPEQARRTWREHMDQVAVEYDLEPRDARWARETETKIQGLLASSRALGDAVESLDCRASCCRVQLKPSQATNFEDDLLRVVHEVGSFLPEAQFDAADPALGKRSTVIYLRTSGHDVAL